MNFSELERHILDELRVRDDLLTAVLEKFCEMKADECRRACAGLPEDAGLPAATGAPGRVPASFRSRVSASLTIRSTRSVGSFSEPVPELISSDLLLMNHIVTDVT